MLVIAALLLLALAAVFLRPHRSEVLPAPLPVVSVAAPEITLSGTIQAAHVVNVPVPVDGAVDQFMADVGQHVLEGQVLARIKNPRFAAALQIAKLNVEQAQNHLNQLESALIAAQLEVSRCEADAMRVKSDLEQAEKAFERQQAMFREGVTPRLAYEKTEREYNSLKAAAQNLAATAKNATDRVDSSTKDLDPARKALAQKTSDLEDAEAGMAVGEVTSPADGVVIERRGKLLQPVTPAISDLFQIAGDPPALEVVAVIQSQMAARIQPGRTVEIEIASVPGPTVGTVRELKSGQVFIDIPNPSPALARDMAVQIRIK
jgi:multidrug resistance efflux pump